MKKIVIIASALILMSVSPAFAGYPEGYLGLFTDQDHTSWCVTGAPWYSIDMWIWGFPNALDGTICADFMICYPANVFPSTITWNGSIIGAEMVGDLAIGVRAWLKECQTDWFWIAHQQLWVTDPTQTYAYICAHPDFGVYRFVNCSPGYPVEPCTVLSNLYLNAATPDPECMGTAVVGASWGAIKNMVSE